MGYEKRKAMGQKPEAMKGKASGEEKVPHKSPKMAAAKKMMAAKKMAPKKAMSKKKM